MPATDPTIIELLQRMKELLERILLAVEKKP